MATSRAAEDIRREIEEREDDRLAAAARNAQLRGSHPAYATQDESLRYPTDPEVPPQPSPIDNARAKHRGADAGILAQPTPGIDGGTSAGEGEAATDLQKADTLRHERERREINAMDDLANLRGDIQKSDSISVGKRAELLDQVARVQRKVEYNRAAATSVGHAHAMRERAVG